MIGTALCSMTSHPLLSRRVVAKRRRSLRKFGRYLLHGSGEKEMGCSSSFERIVGVDHAGGNGGNVC